jgi:hypothetical protein
MPRFLPPFPVRLLSLRPFERYVVEAYGEKEARAIFGREECERLWRLAFPGGSSRKVVLVPGLDGFD